MGDVNGHDDLFLSKVMAWDDCDFRVLQDIDPEILESMADAVTSGKNSAGFVECHHDRMIQMGRENQINDEMALMVMFYLHERCRGMIQCYVDCGRDMMLAKLTWREDY
jgi:hypothetical protein